MALQLTNRRRTPRVTSPYVRAFCRQVLAALKLSHGHLAVTLCDDAYIQELNRTWRNKDAPTDVLSFSQIEGDTPWDGLTVGLPQHVACQLGDIVISMDTAASQAERYGHTLEVEVGRLLIHGILHLLGHDHVHGGEQQALMLREEARLMVLMGLPLQP